MMATRLRVPVQVHAPMVQLTLPKIETLSTSITAHETSFQAAHTVQDLIIVARNVTSLKSTIQNHSVPPTMQQRFKELQTRVNALQTAIKTAITTKQTQTQVANFTTTIQKIEQMWIGKDASPFAIMTQVNNLNAQIQKAKVALPTELQQRLTAVQTSVDKAVKTRLETIGIRLTELDAGIKSSYGIAELTVTGQELTLLQAEMQGVAIAKDLIERVQALITETNATIKEKEVQEQIQAKLAAVEKKITSLEADDFVENSLDQLEAMAATWIIYVDAIRQLPTPTELLRRAEVIGERIENRAALQAMLDSAYKTPDESSSDDEDDVINQDAGAGDEDPSKASTPPLASAAPSMQPLPSPTPEPGGLPVREPTPISATGSEPQPAISLSAKVYQFFAKILAGLWSILTFPYYVMRNKRNTESQASSFTIVLPSQPRTSGLEPNSPLVAPLRELRAGSADSLLASAAPSQSLQQVIPGNPVKRSFDRPQG